MKLSSLHRLALSLAFLIFGGLAVGARAAGGYHLLRKTTLGGEGGWDYLRVDSAARRVYISHATHVIVFDLNQNKIMGDIPDTKGVHGIALGSDLGRGFTSNGRANTVTAFDLSTLKAVGTYKVTGVNPDSILYDPATKRVFTFNGKSANATAIDAETGHVVGTIALSGKPETPVLDGNGSIFVNIETKNALTEINAKTLKVLHTYSIKPCEAPSGIAMDTEHRRIFVGCSDNKMLAVVNADTGKVIATPPIGDDTDAVGFDSSKGLVFASCREGVLSIIHEDSPDKYSVVANVKTEPGARTLAVDSATHHVFVVTSDFTPPPPPTKEDPEPDPVSVAGTFRILEYGE